MKKLNLIFLAFLATFAFSCSSDDDDGGTEFNLDRTAQRADVYVNTASLPQPIFNYISANYPGNTITEAEIEDNNNYEVELNNGTELIFDLQGNFLGIDDDDDDDFGDEDIAPGDLPENIRNFIATHFPGVSIDEAERENNGNYEVELSDDVELIFDSNGDFLGRADDDDNDDRDDEDIAVSDLPEVIRDYITANYPNNTIIEAEREDDGFEVTLNNGIELEFDSAGNLEDVEDHNGDDDDDDDDDEDDDN